jgi:hypothetical protein
MPAIIRSSPGFEETYVMFPHSDVRLARLEVTFNQFPGEGELRTAGSAAGDGLQLTCVRSAASKRVAIRGADFTTFLRLLARLL